MDVALGLARGHQGSTPDRSATEGHDPLARQHTFDQQIIALSVTNLHLAAGEALTVKLDVDD
jgi:hypothetical protein